MEDKNEPAIGQSNIEMGSVPSQPRRQLKSKGNKKLAVILIVIAVILVIGSGLFILGKSRSKSSKEIATPAPADTFIDENTPEPIETATPEPVDRTVIKINILNGTGIPKEASYLQGVLKDLGYEDIKVGNASKQDNTVTNITFKSGLSDTVIDEITGELKKKYESVKTSKSSSLDFDVVVITGLRKGQTPLPSVISTPESTVSPSPSSSPSSSPTTSPTATPEG
jgi:hypothetical protein